MALPVQETMPFPRVSETWPKPPVFQSRNLGREKPLALPAWETLPFRREPSPPSKAEHFNRGIWDEPSGATPMSNRGIWDNGSPHTSGHAVRGRGR